MKYLILTGLLIAGLITGAVYNLSYAENASKPRVVMFSAEWCGSCKILKPKLDQALANHPDLQVVVFDMTDEAAKAKSVEQAAAQGLSDIYNAYAPKTGVAVLVNGQGADTGHLTKANSYDEIDAALTKLETGA